MAEQKDAVARCLDDVAVLVEEVAAGLPETGGLEKTRKWGQLAYLPRKPRVGTTLRLDRYDDHHLALFVHCRTRLVDTFRTLFPEQRFEGTRAWVIPVEEPLPTEALKVFIEATLTYHLK